MIIKIEYHLIFKVRKVLEQLQTEIFLHEKVTLELLLMIGGNRPQLPAEMVKSKKKPQLVPEGVDPETEVEVQAGDGEQVLLHQVEGTILVHSLLQKIFNLKCPFSRGKSTR